MLESGPAWGKLLEECDRIFVAEVPMHLPHSVRNLGVCIISDFQFPDGLDPHKSGQIAIPFFSKIPTHLHL
jgi:hypothetical protein